MLGGREDRSLHTTTTGTGSAQIAGRVQGFSNGGTTSLFHHTSSSHAANDGRAGAETLSSFCGWAALFLITCRRRRRLEAQFETATSQSGCEGRARLRTLRPLHEAGRTCRQIGMAVGRVVCHTAFPAAIRGRRLEQAMPAVIGLTRAALPSGDGLRWAPIRQAGYELVGSGRDPSSSSSWSSWALHTYSVLVLVFCTPTHVSLSWPCGACRDRGCSQFIDDADHTSSRARVRLTAI